MTSQRAGLFGLRAFEWWAIAAAAAIAHAFYWRIVLYPSDFDAKNYLQIAEDIARNGLFSKFYYSNIRTYGYPLFLAGLRELSGNDGARWGFVIFECQLLLYLLAALAIRQAIAVRSSALAPVAFVALVLNFFALSYTPETLSESVSVSLLMLGVACWLRARDSTGPLWRIALLGSLVVSFAVMVRPANLFALVAWWVAVAMVCYLKRLRWGAIAAVVLVVVAGSIAPMLPQYANNLRHYGIATPLVVARLAQNQQIWGIGYLKYATAMPPVPTPSIFYDNPLAKDRPVDPAHPLAWYARFPDAGPATLALHVFNMLDQDLLFTYSRDLDPWYRLPVGVVNHALVALALVGALLMLARMRDATTKSAAIALGLLVLGHVAVHAPTAVEMRFGLPLLVLAGPLAITALQTPRARRLSVAVFVVTYVVAALALSSWVREQAPSIRAWHAAQRSAQQ